MKIFNQEYKEANSKQNNQLGTQRRQFYEKNQLATQRRQLQKKTINQEHKDANSKTKQSTRNIKTPTPKQNNQPGA